MVIFEKPYISELFIKTIAELNMPVLKNSVSEDIVQKMSINLLEEKQFINKFTRDIRLYTNSENSIGWICDNLNDFNIAEKINTFKDKVKFRKLLKAVYPHFFFEEVNIDEIEKIEIDTLPKPFILKPAVGFFSMGVYKISDNEDWQFVKEDIKNNMYKVENLYPKQVIDNTRFIIEECIEGDEFAIDAYYDSKGEPVILNILKHEFSSESDVSDRVYYTSKEIIEEYIDNFSELLKMINGKVNLNNFPFHMEVRVNGEEITPIEINPMRFAGWCTTDIAYYSYGINVYKYYFQNKKPDWKLILKGKDGILYSIVVLDKPKNVDEEQIKKFDYEKLIDSFEKTLELRKIDFNNYPVFGFLFTETKKENKCELEQILKSDLLEYIELK